MFEGPAVVAAGSSFLSFPGIPLTPSLPSLSVSVRQTSRLPSCRLTRFTDTDKEGREDKEGGLGKEGRPAKEGGLSKEGGV